ncbi:MAG TPA: enoyl-CoA hydratase-related protein, partial [Candidatus Binataceae bacterium]|nr:enoyl-CoA hydratase-related protein [Candidatus Binataceae bacterium]
METSEIIYEKSDRIATVTFNRPAKLNSWTAKMGAETRAALLDADRDPGVGAIIMTGAGRAYCSGADMSALSDISAGRASAGGGAGAAAQDAWLAEQRADYRNQYAYPLALSKPIIGAINGACVGLGFTTCLYQDIRIASETARMGLIFVQRGLAIEHGSSWMLSRIVGLGRAVELAVTGRLVDAQEALAIGLVNRVVPADKLIETAREVAGHIANKCSPLGVAHAKKLVYKHLFT